MLIPTPLRLNPGRGSGKVRSRGARRASSCLVGRCRHPGRERPRPSLDTCLTPGGYEIPPLAPTVPVQCCPGRKLGALGEEPGLSDFMDDVPPLRTIVADDDPLV